MLELDPTDLAHKFKPDLGLSTALRIKVNALPMIFSIETAAYIGVDVPYEFRAAERVLADPSFPSRLRAAATIYKQNPEQPEDIWNQLYSGGFFPSFADKGVLEKFHLATPPVKWDLISQMTDPRAKDIARWLVGSEWPEVLSSADRYAIESEFRDHLTKPDVPWTTIPSALAKIKELLSAASGDEIEILTQYKQHLLRL
jgi:hypothetical protein